MNFGRSKQAWLTTAGPKIVQQCYHWYRRCEGLIKQLAPDLKQDIISRVGFRDFGRWHTMDGPIPAWALLAHDSRNISAIGILAGIRWASSSNNDRSGFVQRGLYGGCRAT